MCIRDSQRRVHGDDSKSFPYVLIGNKADKGEKLVSEANVTTWCKDFNDMPYFETSAKTGENVINAFQLIAEMSLKRAIARGPAASPRDDRVKVVHKEAQPLKKKKLCC
eukprot:TRINITY_DN13825_c0_g1_i3.p2 TRINITY_DN13825_c0_g1~~TRINITY_DN13825_c0_g1_i3.p2  ORF type:complete len:109 (+),score=25.10 TRINITY_DN13825_c0_g1_i3:137-463(+)